MTSFSLAATSFSPFPILFRMGSLSREDMKLTPNPSQPVTDRVELWMNWEQIESVLMIAMGTLRRKILDEESAY